MRRISIFSLLAILGGTAYGQNVGIGTPTPEEKLHVKDGNLKLEDSFSLIYNAQAGDTTGIRFRTADLPYGSLLYYATPKMLNISGHDTIHGLLYNFVQNKVFVGRNYQISAQEKFGITHNITTADFGGMYFETKGHSGGKPFYGYAIDSVHKAYHYFDGTTDTWRLNAGGDRMTVNRASGNIGIGLVAPADRLHVAGGDVRIEAPALPTLKLYQGATYASFMQQNGNHTFITNKEAGSLFMGTNNATILTISSIGNVGISMNVPSEKLHVLGNARLDNTIPILKFYQGGTYASYLQQNVDDLEIINKEAGHIRFGTNDLWHMSINSAGNVGINTTGPQDRLHVVGDVRLQGVVASLNFYNGGTHKSFIQQNGINLVVRNIDPGGLFLGTSNSTQILIKSDGNVGIGNTDPLQKLHVTGNTRIENTTPELQFYQGAVEASVIRQNINDLQITNKEVGRLFLGTSDVTQMTIGATGNVGIANTSPFEKLHVSGNARLDNTDPYLQFVNGGTLLGLLSHTGGDLILSNALADDLHLRTNSTNRLSITGAGNVGIGNTSPFEKLHVNGKARLDNISPYLQIVNGGELLC
jgi:hypothetical protein